MAGSRKSKASDTHRRRQTRRNKHHAPPMRVQSRDAAGCSIKPDGIRPQGPGPVDTRGRAPTLTTITTGSPTVPAASPTTVHRKNENRGRHRQRSRHRRHHCRHHDRHHRRRHRRDRQLPTKRRHPSPRRPPIERLGVSCLPQHHHFPDGTSLSRRQASQLARLQRLGRIVHARRRRRRAGGLFARVRR